MKKLFIFIACIAGFAAIYSCEHEDWTYRGPQYYEFSPYENGQNVLNGVFFKENDKIGLDSVCVQLIKHSEEEVVVNYRIADSIYYRKDASRYLADYPSFLDPEDIDTVRSETLPIYGVDYEIVTEHGKFDPDTRKGSIVIPKGEYFGYIEIEMKAKAGASFYVILEDSETCKANVPTSILRYELTPDKITYFTESFLEEIPETWQIIDKDGDGKCWEWYGGKAASDSYTKKTGALTPENYLISPLIEIGSKMKKVMLQFDRSAYSSKYFKEQYRVIASTSPITEDNCRNATILRDWTELDTGDQVTETIDISQYRGKKVYIGFVHGNCTDNYSLEIANVVIYGM